MSEIPHIVHQLWKDERVPARWEAAVRSVRRYHAGWEYRLWTDAAIDDYVRRRHADFHATFRAFERPIMRADVFRYILMHDVGGLYCDLDYEFLRPFDYSGAEIVLSLERAVRFGDDADMIANYVLASAPGHGFWRDVLRELSTQQPRIRTYDDVGGATGPGLLTRIFFAHRTEYSGIKLTDPPVLSPRRVHGRRERKFYLNTGITYGFHHGGAAGASALRGPTCRASSPSGSDAVRRGRRRASPQRKRAAQSANRCADALAQRFELAHEPKRRRVAA